MSVLKYFSNLPKKKLPKTMIFSSDCELFIPQIIDSNILYYNFYKKNQLIPDLEEKTNLIVFDCLYPLKCGSDELFERTKNNIHQILMNNSGVKNIFLTLSDYCLSSSVFLGESYHQNLINIHNASLKLSHIFPKVSVKIVNLSTIKGLFNGHAILTHAIPEISLLGDDALFHKGLSNGASLIRSSQKPDTFVQDSYKISLSPFHGLEIFKREKVDYSLKNKLFAPLDNSLESILDYIYSSNSLLLEY